MDVHRNSSDCLALLLHILEVLGSNLGPLTDSPELGCSFPQCLLGTDEVVPQTRLQPLLSTFLPTYLLIYLLSYLLYILMYQLPHPLIYLANYLPTHLFT